MKNESRVKICPARAILKELFHSAWMFSLMLVLLVTPVSAGAVSSGDNPSGTEPASGAVQQKVIIKGVVFSQSDGLPLPGAMVVEKGTLNATSTDVNGGFVINVEGEQSVLIISFIGLKTKEVQAGNGSAQLDITLDLDNFNLEEVIVTGYGSLKKEAYAGSASIVKMDDLADVPVTNLGQLLQGSTSGVQFTNTSGQPGAATQIRIRGVGSFNASNDPLYVVDGVPIISGNVSGLGTSAGLDILSTLSPSDIESISIIKDAAAASLYGSRAANGVVIITTKKGIAGNAKVNLKTEFGMSDFATDYRPFMDGDERRETIYEGLVNEGTYYLGYDEAASKAHADANIDEICRIAMDRGMDRLERFAFQEGQLSKL